MRHEMSIHLSAQIQPEIRDLDIIGPQEPGLKEGRKPGGITILLQFQMQNGMTQVVGLFEICGQKSQACFTN